MSDTAPLVASLPSLKEQKEAFVSGHDGTSPWELILVCLSAPIGIWLFQLLVSNQHVEKSTRKLILLEYLLVLFPMVLTQTNFLYPGGVVVMAIEFVVACWLWFGQGLGLPTSPKKKPRRRTDKEPSSTSTTNSHSNSLLDCVTCYRSSVLYLTFVAILAVDFQVFPRRFAKTEVFGYGLMDLGAGSFVVAAGLVSPRARNSSLKTRSGLTKRILPLLFMGTVRFVTNNIVEYQEHVSEYGNHWNFFFTIAAMSPLASIMSLPTRWSSFNWVIASMIMAIYQVALLHFGLQEYVQEAPRSCQEPYNHNFVCNLFAANREGILGCVGYTSLYMLSEHLARLCLWGNPNNTRGIRLVGCSTGLWILHYVMVDMLGITVSRRTTNATYCVWTLAHNVTILTFLWVAMESVTNSTVPPIFKAVNNNGLLVFVVANLLTGLANLSVNTLEADDTMALSIIFAYLCAVGGFALLADGILVPFLTRRGGQSRRREKIA